MGGICSRGAASVCNIEDRIVWQASCSITAEKGRTGNRCRLLSAFLVQVSLRPRWYEYTTSVSIFLQDLCKALLGHVRSGRLGFKW